MHNYDDAERSKEKTSDLFGRILWDREMAEGAQETVLNQSMDPCILDHMVEAEFDLVGAKRRDSQP